MTAARRKLSPAPTLGELAAHILELHECVDTVAGSVSDLTKVVKEDRHDSKNRDTVLDARLHGLERTLDLISKFLGVPQTPRGEEPPQPRKTVGGWDRWQAVAAMVGAAGGGITIYKIAATVLTALNHAVLTAH